MYFTHSSELSQVYTMLAVLLNLEACAEEFLDNIITDVDTKDVCYVLEAVKKIPDAARLLNIIRDKCPCGTFYSVTEALGIEDDMDEEYPIAQYLAAVYLSAHEHTRELVFDAIKDTGGVKTENPTLSQENSQRYWRKLYSSVTPTQIKICESWVCPEY